MFDPIESGLRAVSTHQSYAPALVFITGVLTSSGPCSAPRFVAAAGLAANAGAVEVMKRITSLTAGLVTAYAGLACIASLAGRIGLLSAYVYAALGCALVVTALCAIARSPREHCCNRMQSAGSCFFLGASFALMVSPCCTPVVLAIIAYCSAAGNVAYGSVLLACFALGHAVPLFALGVGAQRITRLTMSATGREAYRLGSSILMLALGAYYLVLV